MPSVNNSRNIREKITNTRYFYKELTGDQSAASTTEQEEATDKSLKIMSIANSSSRLRKHTLKETVPAAVRASERELSESNTADSNKIQKVRTEKEKNATKSLTSEDFNSNGKKNCWLLRRSLSQWTVLILQLVA